MDSFAPLFLEADSCAVDRDLVDRFLVTGSWNSGAELPLIESEVPRLDLLGNSWLMEGMIAFGGLRIACFARLKRSYFGQRCNAEYERQLTSFSFMIHL